MDDRVGEALDFVARRIRRLTAATNLILLGDRTAASDTIAAILADSNAFFLTRAAAATDPFWQMLKGERSFDQALAGP